MYRLIAYLGILASIILGGILGLIALVLVFAALEVHYLSIVHLLIGIALGASFSGILAVIRVRRYLRERREKQLAKHLASVPENAGELIKSIIRQMRYRKEVRQDVRAELVAHFEDELKDCKSEEERDKKAQQLITDFGDVKLLAVLLRRAKKRCRPLWVKALVRSFQVSGVIFLYFLVCSTTLMIGKPTVSVNYVEWLNELVQGGKRENENARPYYEKAIKDYVKVPEKIEKIYTKWPEEMNDLELAVLSDWLAENKQAIGKIREGAEKQYYWNDYSIGIEEKSFKDDQIGTSYKIVTPGIAEFGIIEEALEPLSKYGNLAKMMAACIYWQAYNDNVRDAVKDSLVLYKMGFQLQGKGLLIEQLVGIAIEGLANDRTLKLLAKTDVPENVLEETLQELRIQLGQRKLVINFEAEKAFWYDNIQRIFTDDGKGNGRPLVRAIPFVIKDWKDMLWKLITFNFPGRSETVRQIDNYFEQVDVLLNKSPKRLYDSDVSIDDWTDFLPDNLMFRILSPANSRIGRLTWRLKTGRRALLATLALLRYSKEKGTCPEKLNDLVQQGYLRELPIDPYSDRPFGYIKEDEGFILYSVGSNFTDDGGKIFRTDKGKAKQYADEGDWVFWPVRK